MSSIVNANGQLFVRSKNIKVYPCASRGGSATTSEVKDGKEYILPGIFDPESRLNTENNAINHVGTNGFSKNCILNWDIATQKLKLLIYGYSFEINNLDFQKDIIDNKIEYAVIKLNTIDLVENNGLANPQLQTKMLTSLATGGGSILDTEVLPDTFAFTGLLFTTAAGITQYQSTANCYYIKLIENGQFNNKLFLPKFSGGDGKNSIVTGENTTAENKDQFTIGHYNKALKNALFVVGNGTPEDPSNAFAVDSSGSIEISGQFKCKQLVETSDRRLKENIEEFKPNTEKSILDLPIYKYTYKDDPSHKPHIGFMAQDVQEVCPEIVVEDHDGYLAIENSKLIYLLIQEMKDLKAKIK